MIIICFYLPYEIKRYVPCPFYNHIFWRANAHEVFIF